MVSGTFSRRPKLRIVYDESHLLPDGTPSTGPDAGSELWVIDAKRMGDGMDAVVCRIKLPQRVPYGWVSFLEQSLRADCTEPGCLPRTPRDSGNFPTRSLTSLYCKTSWPCRVSEHLYRSFSVDLPIETRVDSKGSYWRSCTPRPSCSSVWRYLIFCDRVQVNWAL